MASADITKRVIADTIKKLMMEKPLAKISIGDIVEHCGINRNSFYYHFKDKYDLINWIFYTEITQSMNQEDVLTKSSWTLLQEVLEFLYQDKAFYRNALSVSGQNSFAEYFMELLKTLVKTRAFDMFDEDEDREFVATFFADAFVATVFRWLINGAKMTPEKMVMLIRKAANGSVNRLIKDGEIEINDSN
ncbi:MAG: TetR family transcriptional regulator [Clostridiales bacterium]|nr:TetR family transcriptional regulator [Clostridiales bacterium]